METTNSDVQFSIEGIKFTVREHYRLGVELWIGDPYQKHTYVGMRREMIDFYDVLPLHIQKVAHAYRQDGVEQISLGRR